MNIKTITTVDGVNVVDFGSAASRFYWIENLGSTVVYVSGNENIVPDGDNVKVLSAGCGTMVENLGGKVYILGAGKFQITNQGDKFPPFRNAPTFDGGVMASGNPVQIDGLQGGVPFSEISVSGKNLFGDVMNYYLSGTQKDGFTFKPSSANSFCFLGTIINNNNYTIKSYSNGNRFKIVLFKNYPNQAAPDECMEILPTDSNTVTFNSGKYNYCVLSVAYNDENITIKKAQLEIGSTPTEYEPPITGRELTVNVCGKNLMKYPYYNTTQTQNGVTFTDNGDGSITVNGTATATAYFSLSSNKALPTGKYVLGKSTENVWIYVDKYLDNAFYQRVATSMGIVKELIFNVSEEDAQKYTYRFGIQFDKGNIADNVTIYPQLELGGTATEYEPYHGAEYTITPTSNPYVIPNDIRQVDGRNVVSVSAGELSVTGVRKNAAVKKIWDEIDEIKTAIIVSNGETE